MEKETTLDFKETMGDAREVLTDMGLTEADSLSDAEIVGTLVQQIIEQESTIWMLEVAIDKGLSHEETDRWIKIAEERLETLQEGQDVTEEDLEALVQKAKSGAPTLM